MTNGRHGTWERNLLRPAAGLVLGRVTFLTNTTTLVSENVKEIALKLRN
jgi:hypothetical protein